MDASVSEPAARPAWDFIFSLFPGLTFLGLAAIALIGVARMPSHSSSGFSASGSPFSAALLGFIALLLLVIAVAGRSADMSVAARFREGIDYVYWFVLKVAVFMYLFIWYRATWPRYRFDQLMRSDGKCCCRFAGRADSDRHRGGDIFMNPAMNSGLNSAAQPRHGPGRDAVVLLSAGGAGRRQRLAGHHAAQCRALPRWR
jgi:hypothetical protein